MMADHVYPENRRQRLMTAIVRQIAVDDLVPTPDNPRILCETSPEFLDLVASVRASGVLVHVLARPTPPKRANTTCATAPDATARPSSQSWPPSLASSATSPTPRHST